MKKILFILSIISLIITVNFSESYASVNKYIATKAGLRLRTSPDKSSKVITLIPFGQQVTIIKEEGDEIFMDGRYGKWVNINSGKKTGWVFSGFLCDFNPAPLTRQVAAFYRNKYSRNEAIVKFGYTEYTQFKDDEVSLVNIIDDYILLIIPTSSSDSLPDISKGNVVWKYNKTDNQFTELYDIGHENTTELFYLDNDKYPDILVEYGCCGSVTLEVLMGSGNKFIKVDEISGDDSYSEKTSGQCDKTTFSVSNIMINNKTVKIKSAKVDVEEREIKTVYYKFNCSKRKMEKFAEGKVNEDIRGIIKSVDKKNKLLVLTDRDDDKDKTFIISDKVIVSGEEKNLSIDTLQTGNYIGLRVESLSGKDIIHVINYWGQDAQSHYSSVEGVILGIDSSSKQLALKLDRATYIYNIPSTLKNYNGTQPLSELKPGDKIKMTFKAGKINTIDKK